MSKLFFRREFKGTNIVASSYMALTLVNRISKLIAIFEENPKTIEPIKRANK